MNKRFIFSGILLATLAAAGCAALNEVRFTVNSSSLDYAQFRVSRPSPVDGHAETIRIDLSGSGFLEVTTGRSERVGNSVWQESENPDWQDLHRDHVMLTETETVAVFQRLVNAGIFDYKQPAEKTPPPPDLAVLLAIGFQKRLILTRRPEYRQVFDMLLEKCQNPAR